MNRLSFSYIAFSVVAAAAALCQRRPLLSPQVALDQATALHHGRLRIGSGKRTILNMRPSHAGKPESYYRRPNVPGSVRREQQRRMSSESQASTHAAGYMLSDMHP